MIRFKGHKTICPCDYKNPAVSYESRTQHSVREGNLLKLSSADNMLEFLPFPYGTYFGFEGADTGFSVILHHNTPVFKSRTPFRYWVHCWDGKCRIWDYRRFGRPLPLSLKHREVEYLEALAKETKRRGINPAGEIYIKDHQCVTMQLAAYYPVKGGLAWTYTLTNANHTIFKTHLAKSFIYRSLLSRVYDLEGGFNFNWNIYPIMGKHRSEHSVGRCYNHLIILSVCSMYHPLPAPFATYFGFEDAHKGNSVMMHHNTPVYRSRTPGRYIVHCWDGVIRIWDYRRPGPPMPGSMKVRELCYLERLVRETQRRENKSLDLSQTLETPWGTGKQVNHKYEGGSLAWLLTQLCLLVLNNLHYTTKFKDVVLTVSIPNREKYKNQSKFTKFCICLNGQSHSGIRILKTSLGRYSVYGFIALLLPNVDKGQRKVITITIPLSLHAIRAGVEEAILNKKLYTLGFKMAHQLPPSFDPASLPGAPPIVPTPLQTNPRMLVFPLADKRVFRVFLGDGVHRIWDFRAVPQISFMQRVLQELEFMNHQAEYTCDFLTQFEGERWTTIRDQWGETPIPLSFITLPPTPPRPKRGRDTQRRVRSCSPNRGQNRSRRSFSTRKWKLAGEISTKVTNLASLTYITLYSLCSVWVEHSFSVNPKPYKTSSHKQGHQNILHSKSKIIISKTKWTMSYCHMTQGFPYCKYKDLTREPINRTGLDSLTMASKVKKEKGYRPQGNEIYMKNVCASDYLSMLPPTKTLFDPSKDLP